MLLTIAMTLVTLVLTVVPTALGIAEITQSTGLNPIVCTISIVFMWGLLALRLGKENDHMKALEDGMDDLLEAIYQREEALVMRVMALNKETKVSEDKIQELTHRLEDEGVETAPVATGEST